MNRSRAPTSPRPRAGCAPLAALAAAILTGAGVTAGAAAGGERTFTDSAGRRVEVPGTVKRVFAAGPPAAIIRYTLAPDALLGWNRALRPAERGFIAPAYRDLPELGRLTGRGDTANVEVVLDGEPLARLAPPGSPAWAR